MSDVAREQLGTSPGVQLASFVYMCSDIPDLNALDCCPDAGTRAELFV